MESAPATVATPPAPAQPAVAPPAQTISASDAAVSKSTVDYREARRAERAGKPLPEVPVATKPPEPTAAAPAAPPQLSKRQQDINERSQRAVEAATATLREENARLARELAAARPAAPAQPAAPASVAVEPPAAPVEAFPSLQDWSEKNPTKTIEDYMDARADHRETQRAHAARVEQQFREQAESLTKRGQVFVTRMQEAKAAEPDLASKIPPALADTSRDTRPLSAFSPQDLSKATFTNVVAEAMFRSERPAEIAKYLHTHQDEAVQIAGLPVMDALLALAVIDGRLTAPTSPSAPTAPAPRSRKTLTDAPAPLETLGTRPAEATDPETAAIRSGNTRAYRELRRQQRADKLVRLR